MARTGFGAVKSELCVSSEAEVTSGYVTNRHLEALCNLFPKRNLSHVHETRKALGGFWPVCRAGGGGLDGGVQQQLQRSQGRWQRRQRRQGRRRRWRGGGRP